MFNFYWCLILDVSKKRELWKYCMKQIWHKWCYVFPFFTPKVRRDIWLFVFAWISFLIVYHKSNHNNGLCNISKKLISWYVTLTSKLFILYKNIQEKNWICFSQQKSLQKSQVSIKIATVKLETCNM